MPGAWHVRIGIARTLDCLQVAASQSKTVAAAQDYYFADGLGSTVTLARDSEPGESAAWTYDAFGEVRSESGTLSTAFLFTGERRDEASEGMVMALPFAHD